MRDTPTIELVVVQPTPFCNIDCKYCYLPNRSVKRVIERRTLENLFTKLFASGWAVPDVTIIWHAGEPLVLPIAFYREAFDLIEALRPPGIAVSHSMQTNGMLISGEWCDFFTERQVRIGVSIDGPQRIHDRQRVTRSGRGTFARTIRGIRLLRERHMPFHVISVLSRESLDAAQEFYDFYVSEGIDQVCFNVEESEGDHVSKMLADGDAQTRYRAFLGRFWQLARAGEAIAFIREIDGMLPKIFRPNEAAVHNPQTEPFAILNVDCAGNVSTFSPELLGHKHDLYSDFLIGNVNDDTFDAMLASPALAAMQRDIAAGVEACRAECGYFSVCGGGAPANKLSENGSFRSTATGFCRLTEMAVTDLILASFERAERMLDGGGAQAVLDRARALTAAPA